MTSTSYSIAEQDSVISLCKKVYTSNIRPVIIFHFSIHVWGIACAKKKQKVKGYSFGFALNLVDVCGNNEKEPNVFVLCRLKGT